MQSLLRLHLIIVSRHLGYRSGRHLLLSRIAGQRTFRTETFVTMSTVTTIPSELERQSKKVPFFAKPLNVLVHLDEQLLIQHQMTNDVKRRPEESPTLWIQNKNELYKSIRNTLLALFGQRYLIYPITTEDLRSKPWTDTTKLVICITRDLVSETDFLSQAPFQALQQFVQSERPGRFCLLHVASICSDDRHCNDNPDTFLVDTFVAQLRERLGNAFFDEFDVNDQAITLPQVTPHYFLNKSSGSDSIQSESFETNGCVLIVGNEDTESRIEQALKADYIPIVITFDEKFIKTLNFDLKEYFERLKTTRLGRSLIYADVTRSTHPLVEMMTTEDGLVVVARQQVNGRGRGENQWISPAGSINFSFSFTIDTNSRLFQSVGFVQHLAALAVLQAIKESTENPQLDIKIKWPNDIYWSNQHKLVGILITSKIQGRHAQFFIGIGVNLDNDHPTRSLSNLIDQHCPGTKKPSAEQIVAGTLSRMQTLLDWFESTRLKDVINEYCSNWCMSGHLIRLKDGTTATVVGVDCQGYLKVKVEDDRIVSLHPDGNRFDMICNLSPAPASEHFHDNFD